MSCWTEPVDRLFGMLIDRWAWLAFVREPEGNACAERFVRMLKENLLWV